MLVTIERRGPGQVAAFVGDDCIVAEYDRDQHKWRVETPRGTTFSNSAKLHSLVKLLGGEREYKLAKRERCPMFVLPDVSPPALRQVRRMLDSMQEFRFVPARHWHQPIGHADLKEGYSYRVGGDPIYHTLVQVAGVDATRAEVEEALAAIVAQRQPALPPRHAPFLVAIPLVAEALVENRRSVRTSDGLSVPVLGPVLPPNWDEPLVN